MQARAMSLCFVVLIPSLLVASGCETLKGEVIDGRYHSPAGNYSIDPPNFSGLKIRDSGDEQDGFVIFTGSFFGVRGGGWLLEYARIPPSRLAKLRDPAAQDKLYRGVMRDVLLPKVQGASPDAAILNEGPMSVGGHRAHFALMRIPHGTNIWNVKEERYDDAIAGFLVFHHGEYAYTMNVDLVTPMSASSLDAPLSENVRQAKEILTRFKSSITFN